jgi:flagellar motor component MotA
MEGGMKKIIFAVLIFFTAIVLYGFMFGFYFLTYVDLLAILAIPIISTIYTFFIFGYKDSKNSFKILFKKNATQKELKLSESFNKIYGESTITISVLCSLLSIIDMFLKFNDRMELGPRFAFSLMCILYALIIYVLVIIPCRVHIKERM